MNYFRPKLTPEQRAQARRRWEGSPAETYGWLATECLAAWGVRISRQALRKASIKGGWQKGGPPSQPLAYVPPRVRVNQPAEMNVPVPNIAPVPTLGLVTNTPTMQKQRLMIARTGARFVRLRGCPPGR